MGQHKLTSEHWTLKTWLEEHFIPGRYFTIREICDNVVDKNGRHIFEYNTDPYKHDHCLKLSTMVREINWNICEGYKIIIKDSKGSIKLCESEEEFNKYKQHEMDKLLPKYQYLNNLKWKADRDGVVPIINQANNPVKEYKPIDVYAHEKVVKSGRYAGMTVSELINQGIIDTFKENNRNE